MSAALRAVDVQAPLLGSTEPRLWTPPLRDLTEPGASYGPDVVAFAADVLEEPLDPWQEWLCLHAGELLPDGRPRFRTVLTIVGRQAGKTHLLRTLALFWLFVERHELVLGMSTTLTTAQESWQKAVEASEASEVLRVLVPKGGVRRANGEQTLATVDGCRYKIAASNRQGGRGLSVDRLILDELREHHTFEAWDAATHAMNARPFGQAWAITNQGDVRSVVLTALRDSALSYIDAADGDPRLGLFEWSAPDGADVDDPDALAAANPNVGRRIDWDTLLGPARRAKAAGGDQEAGYRTEVLCQRVERLRAAIDKVAWARGLEPGTLDDVRARVALCVDISPDARHATLTAAAVLADGRVRVEPVAAWSGESCTADLRRDLIGWVQRVKPAALGWFPSGPAAALAADLAKSDGPGRSLLERALGKTPEPIRADDSAACMGLADLVTAGQLVHSGDPLQDDHVTGAEKSWTKARWVFARPRDGGHCDAAYAAAGAVHLARTLPAPMGRPRIIRASGQG